MFLNLLITDTTKIRGAFIPYEGPSSSHADASN